MRGNLWGGGQGLPSYPMMPPEWRSRSVLSSSPQTPTLLRCLSLQVLTGNQQLLRPHLPTPGCVNPHLPTVTSRCPSIHPARLSMINQQLSEVPWRPYKTCASKSRLVWSLPRAPEWPGSSHHQIQSHRTWQRRGIRDPRVPRTSRAPSQRLLGLRQKGRALPCTELGTCNTGRKPWLSRSLVHRGPGQDRGKTPLCTGLGAPQKNQVPSHSGPGVP